MKKFLSLIFFVLILTSCHSQQNPEGRVKIARSGDYIKIPISDVKLAKLPLEEESFRAVIQKLSFGDIEAYSPSDSARMLVSTRLHPFVAALHYSFAQHRPIVISPDMVWLMILQGFAKHVEYEADSLQNVIVDFEGKKKLSVRRDEFIRHSLSNDWNEVFDEFSQKIYADIDSNLSQLMQNNFTTTGPKETIAYQIALMDAMSEFFVYELQTACGIPYVILEGTPEDWLLIKEQLPKFRKYNLDFWIDNLQPVVDELYEASKGSIDTLFWKSIYKWDSGSGGSGVSGWVIRFFPYLEDYGEMIWKNTKLNEDYFKNHRCECFCGIPGWAFPSALSSCDFLWHYYDNDINMKFCAGFIGISQDDSLLLRPEINWFVAEKTVPDSFDKYLDVYDEESYEHYYQQGMETEIISILPEFHPSFYTVCEKPDIYPIFDKERYDDFEEGWDAFEKFLKDSSVYIMPRVRSEGNSVYKDPNLKSGKVKVEIVISPKGEIYCTKVISDPKYLSSKVMRLFRKSPKWKPAQKDGKYAMVKMEVEIDLIAH